jgi:hypothetical protein
MALECGRKKKAPGHGTFSNDMEPSMLVFEKEIKYFMKTTLLPPHI